MVGDMTHHLNARFCGTPLLKVKGAAPADLLVAVWMGVGGTVTESEVTCVRSVPLLLEGLRT